jgi:adenylate cyclase
MYLHLVNIVTWRLKAGIATKEAKAHLLGNGSINIFTGLRSQQWELRWLVAVNHREVFKKWLPQTCEVKSLEAVIPVRL